MTEEGTEAGASTNQPMSESDIKMKKVKLSDSTHASDSKESSQPTSPARQVPSCEPTSKQNNVEETKGNASNSSGDELPALLDFDWREKSTVSEDKSKGDSTGLATSTSRNNFY